MERSGLLATEETLFLFLPQFAPNVGPELLHYIRQRVISDLCSPNFCCVSNPPVRVRVVTIGGNGRRKRASEDLGIVELGFSIVASCHEDAGERIPGAATKAAVAGKKIRVPALDSPAAERVSSRLQRCGCLDELGIRHRSTEMD